jgi:hypothetical protein
VVKLSEIAAKTSGNDLVARSPFQTLEVWQSVNFRAKQAGVAVPNFSCRQQYFASMIDSCSIGQSCVGYGVCLFNPQHQRTVGDEVLAEPRTSGIPNFATMCK